MSPIAKPLHPTKPPPQTASPRSPPLSLSLPPITPATLYNLPAMSPPTAQPGPALPPAIASVRNASTEEFLKQMNKMPLFMTELDEVGEDGGENAGLEALKALAYEGEPEEVAGNFRSQGNECYKARQFKDAVEFYTKAIAVRCDVAEINEACYANRAACNLELRTPLPSPSFPGGALR